MKQHPVASFYVLSYAISWVLWVPAVLYIKFYLPTDQVPGWLMIPNLVGSWGPFFAALAVTGILEGKPGAKKLLARLLVWRVGFLCQGRLPKRSSRKGTVAIVWIAASSAPGRCPMARWYLIRTCASSAGVCVSTCLTYAITRVDKA
jgi:hypothetical protein